jgi:hypothetical protein
VTRDPAATYDLLERKQPHRLGFVHFARAIPGYLNQFTTEVPGDFVAQVSVDEVDVACPCGETPRVGWMTPTGCACERTFVNLGTSVRVAYGGAADGS